MSKLPTGEEFRSLVDAHHGLFDPRGELTKSRNRSHTVSILAGAFLNSCHRSIAAVLNETSIARDDPLMRTDMTLDLLDKIEYGEPETAAEAAELLWKIHEHASATLADGTVVTAIDTDLLAVALITGFRCTAALMVLENITTPHYDQAKADELFASYWAERAGLMSAVGIPLEYLPSSPVEAVQWWSDQLEQNMSIDAAQHAVEDAVDSFEHTAATQVAGPADGRGADKSDPIAGRRRLGSVASSISSGLGHAVSGAVVHMVHTIAYFAAPSCLRIAAWPDGPPALGHMFVMGLPVTKHLPDWMMGGIPWECPQARRVKELLDEEGTAESSS